MSYEDLKPISGEAQYVDWDEEFCFWAVFGADSGFCFSQHNSYDEAQDACVEEVK